MELSLKRGETIGGGGGGYSIKFYTETLARGPPFKAG